MPVGRCSLFRSLLNYESWSAYFLVGFDLLVLIWFSFFPSAFGLLNMCSLYITSFPFTLVPVVRSTGERRKTSAFWSLLPFFIHRLPAGYHLKASDMHALNCGERTTCVGFKWSSMPGLTVKYCARGCAVGNWEQELSHRFFLAAEQLVLVGRVWRKPEKFRFLAVTVALLQGIWLVGLMLIATLKFWETEMYDFLVSF